LYGKIHIGATSITLEEAKKIAESNSTRNLTDINVLSRLKQPSWIQVRASEKEIPRTFDV